MSPFQKEGLILELYEVAHVIQLQDRWELYFISSCQKVPFLLASWWVKCHNCRWIFLMYLHYVSGYILVNGWAECRRNYTLWSFLLLSVFLMFFCSHPPFAFSLLNNVWFDLYTQSVYEMTPLYSRQDRLSAVNVVVCGLSSSKRSKESS